MAALVSLGVTRDGTQRLSLFLHVLDGIVLRQESSPQALSGLHEMQLYERQRRRILPFGCLSSRLAREPQAILRRHCCEPMDFKIFDTFRCIRILAMLILSHLGPVGFC